MRRLVRILLALVAVLALPGPAGTAQESPTPSADPQVRLTLLEQTPWSSSGWSPASQRDLRLSFRAENLGPSPFDELSIGVSLYGRLITRTAYELSLTQDQGFVIDAETFAAEGRLEPGVPRDFEVQFTLDSPGINPDQSGVYPLKVDLRSGSISLATIRTPVVFLVREPEVPLSLSWTFVLDAPIAFRPDGVFVSASLEDALASGGRLAAQIEALVPLATGPFRPEVDLVVSPVLLQQLGRMQDGYEVLVEGEVQAVPPGEGATTTAERAIADLVTIAAAPNVRVTALPYSGPELPALVSGGLAGDMEVQLERGREVVASVLGVSPTSTVLRPPGAVVDEATLRELPDVGVTTLVVGPGTVEQVPQALGFAGPPTAALGRDGALDAIVPDPAVATLLQEGLVDEDPVRAAQAVLGELAAIWQEQPGEPRGIAVVLSEDAALPGAFFGPFARGIAGAPWLRPMHAFELAATFPAAEPSALVPAIARSVATTYVDELKQARRRVAIYRSMLLEDSDEPGRMDTMLLLAEARQFLSTPEQGMAFIDDVQAAVGAVFNAVTLETVEEITLTSSTGSGIPVTITNGSDVGLRLTVRLQSPNLRTPVSRDLELAAGASQTVRFQVELKTTGRSQVFVRVLSPDGRPIVRETTINVRSTVYNRIALVITAGAALVLLVLWARRFVPRRTP